MIITLSVYAFRTQLREVYSHFKAYISSLNRSIAISFDYCVFFVRFLSHFILILILYILFDLFDSIENTT